ncbi:PhoX domain-containing protein [Neolentinus lepideus HHB14362 ss-1]|uniref:PhoX domain-containing protein n=1 Tax=Neolentinus lepideus HHB14362 ss-1 TaxID=1314782 RepID=A0A165W7B7_9AGAM|nr:PhoX domain-containing protein [Neolentinus lepideus HHB14362 ss-1]
MQVLVVQVAAGVVLLAVGTVAVARILSSPLALVLLSPLVFLGIAASFLAFNVAAAYLLDWRRPKSTRSLLRSARPLAFSTPAAWQAVLTRSQWAYKSPQSLSPLLPQFPVVSTSINEVLILIVRDFVLTWYKDISASPSFPTAVSSTLHSSMERLIERTTPIDLPSLVVKRILPAVTAHIEQFRQSEVALRGQGLERKLTQSEELDLLLASRYAGRKGGKLHPAIDNLSSTFTRQSEEAHLRSLVEKALPYILPEKEGHSRAVKIVVREIVACSVLYPIMEMLSDPDFWNRMIDEVAGAAIRQQKLVSKVRNVLEAQAPRTQPRHPSNTSAPAETITIRTDLRGFESFLKSINRCSSLLDARRLKSDILREIRRTRTSLANHENEDWINGERTEDVVAFLDRLYTAKRKVEQRIVLLGGGDDSTLYQDIGPNTSRITLRDILTNPSSLSYFMEFMDRRSRSLLVQFWLTVESFKNPLESVDSDSDGEGHAHPIHDLSRSSTAKEDISMVHELYFSGASLAHALGAISQKHVDVIRAFASGYEEDQAGERRARRSVMLAQRQVEKDMEADFEEFQRSDLWFRVIGDVEFVKKNGSEQALEGPVRASTGPLPARGSGGPDARGHQRPHFIVPRSESAPLLGMARTPKPPSVQSGRSGRSSPSGSSAGSIVPPARGPQSTLEVLMSPAPDTTDEVSRAPLFDDPEEQAHMDRVEAIQAALTDIIALDNEQEKKPPLVRAQAAAPSPRSDSLGDERKRRVLFEDEAEADGGNDNQEEEGHGSFQLAGPGDLQLSYEIARLGDKINSLQSQDAMLDTLINKAELTGDAQELRLLRTSRSSLRRELRELRFQKDQYEQQDSANRLVADRTKVSIVNSTVGEESGKSVVRYVVEVHQLVADGSFGSGWVVARRYNEFLNMHNKLKERYVQVRGLDFPGKRLVTALSGSFVDARRAGLEKYLQNLISVPAVCESDELRSFLSRESPFMTAEPPPTSSKTPVFPAREIARTVFNSVAESIDDMFFGPSMLDVMLQRLTRQAAEFAGLSGTGATDEDLVSQALRASGKNTNEETLMQLSGDLKPLEGESSTSSFSAPICDLILAVFELNKKNNWLRRQAIVIILQQVLGGTIERRIYESARTFFDESRLLGFVRAFKDGLWPGGQLKPPGVPRTAEAKSKTRNEANRKLSALIPGNRDFTADPFDGADLAANTIGRSNARRGARRIFAVLQNRRLNQHIIYTIVDEVCFAMQARGAGIDEISAPGVRSNLL